MPPATVALVGPDQQDNMGLRYLASSVEAAGHRAMMVRFDGASDRERCVAQIIAAHPDAVGLSISFQYAIGDYLSLAEKLRSGGYEGHITCGGHVPTFCHQEILGDAPGIDSVVRHEGEQTLIDLLDRLGRGEAPRDMPGLVWREGGGIQIAPVRPPLEQLDTLPWPKRRKKLMTIGGVPVAFLIGSRGCTGECVYCCIRAFGREAGGRRLRLRSPASIADEIAALYRNQGARVFFFLDDLFLLPGRERAISRLRALRRELRDRGVDRAVYWTKGRPETITPPLVEELRELGVFHLFLGVESASSERLRYLGRTHQPEDNERAIALLAEHGLGVSFNLMLFDPDSSLEDIEISLEMGRDHAELPWNICRTEVYSGTTLRDRLEAEGRLLGDYRSYGYDILDRRTEVAFRLMRIGFAERASAVDGLLNKLVSLNFARQVHGRLFPGPATAAADRLIGDLIREAHLDTVDEMLRIVEFARRTSHDDIAAIRNRAVETAMAVNLRDNGRIDRVTRLFEELDARGAARLGRLNSV